MEVGRSTVPGLIDLERGTVGPVALEAEGANLFPELVTVGVRGFAAVGHFALEVGMTSLFGLKEV